MNDIEEIIQPKLSEEAQDYRNLAEIAYDAKGVLKNIDKEFEDATQLNETDVGFLMFAVALQCIRQYVLTKMPERLNHNEAAKQIKGNTPQKSGLQNNLLNPSLDEILRNPVPYDIAKYSDGYKTLAEYKSGKRALQGGGSRGHRVSTLGHDPLLGLVFGTANIATSTLTNNRFQSYHVISQPTASGKLINAIDYPVPLSAIFASVESKLMHEATEGKTKVAMSLIKEVHHLKSDINTKNSLPFPGTSINPALANKLADYGLDAQNLAVFSTQATYAQFINIIIAMLHGLCYYGETNQSKKLLSPSSYQRVLTHNLDSEEEFNLHKVKTKKILSYSNIIASTSNAIYVAISKDVSSLDIGGLAVTLYQLIHNRAFIQKVKQEFLKEHWHEIVLNQAGGLTMNSTAYKAAMGAGAAPFAEVLEQKAQEAGATDTEKDDFPACRTKIHSNLFSIFPDEAKAKFQETNEKRLEKFRLKYLPMIAPRAIVAYASVGKNDFLFTTWGLHVRLSGKKSIESIAYEDIDFNKSKLRYNEKGQACGYTLSEKYSNAEIDLLLPPAQSAHIDWAVLNSLFLSLKSATTAVRDIPQSIFDLEDDIKYAYGEVMLSFCFECQIGTIEALRMAYELNMGDTKFASLIQASTKISEYESFDEKIAILISKISFPSVDSVINELIQHLISVWQHETGCPRDISANAEQHLRTLASAVSLQKTYGTITKNDAADKAYADFISSAKINYRIIKNDINTSEIDALYKAMFSVIGATGFPLATVGVSSYLWWNTLWFYFIPGIGTIATTAAIGAATAGFIASTIKKQPSEKRELLLNDEAKSYEHFARYIQIMPQSDLREKLIESLTLSAVRTDESLHTVISDAFSRYHSEGSVSI